MVAEGREVVAQDVGSDTRPLPHRRVEPPETGSRRRFIVLMSFDVVEVFFMGSLFRVCVISFTTSQSASSVLFGYDLSYVRRSVTLVIRPWGYPERTGRGR
jgi:hypothetical protein